MKAKTIFEMSDIELDKTIKIQGTKHDRKRVLTDRQVTKAKRLLSNGVSVTDVAKLMGVHPNTIKYNTDPVYRETVLKTASGIHTGVTRITRADRITYKRELVARGEV